LIIGNARLAWLRQTQGDAAGSRAAIHAALVRVQSNPGSRYWPLPSIEYYQTRLWIAQGNLTAASQWMQESGLDLKDTPVTFFNEKEYLAQARLRIAQGKPEAADMILSRLRQVAEPAGRRGSLIEILILQALTFYQQKRNGESMPALDQALGLAEGEGFVRIFLDEGQPMVTLLRQAVAQGLHAPFALRLLYAFGETEAASQPLVEPLSEREQEVLRRMAAGYSNQEIAQELVVAVSTVKKHINNIYGKLGVGSRTQAVARAREFGLL
jgi:LuxR family maltose regulon positive regulatory protein